MSRFFIFLRGMLRHFSRALLLVTLVVSVATLLVINQHSNDASSVQAALDDGWGSEVLSLAYDGISSSIIPLANACGIGASSCYKCHNGKRAGAPDMDVKKAPWHKEHAKVNNSCAGCHKGNPRLMKESMAHNRMISDPRDKLQQACSTCHAGDDLDTLSKPYLSLRGNNK